MKAFSVFALVMWSGDETISGGHPISSFQISYRLKNDSRTGWQPCLPEYISPKEVIFILVMHDKLVKNAIRFYNWLIFCFKNAATICVVPLEAQFFLLHQNLGK